MLKDTDAIIFDMDDTLYLERDYVKSGFDAVGLALDCPGFGTFCWERFLDGVRGNTFDLALAAFPGVHAEIRDLVDVYRRHRVCFHWLKGHAGHPENERCDALAVNAGAGAVARGEILPEDSGYMNENLLSL